MAMPASKFYTAEMVRARPDDGNRYETVHGQLLVTPAPRALHQRVLRRLFLALGNYLRDQPVGELYFSPADISWAPDTLVQPDLFVVSLEEARMLDWERMKTLLLAVEGLSPSSLRADRVTKRLLYQEQLIPLYWIVDCDAEAVEVWTPEVASPVVETQRLIWYPAGASAPCVIELAEVFAPL
jgi:Uma2 family endonuclease